MTMTSDMEIIWIFIGLVVLAAALLFFIWKTRRSRLLTATAASRIRALLQKAERVPDPVLRIIEYDKVLDQLLLELGFHGSTGQKLMKAGSRFKNKDALWKNHKLRNVIAHEHGAGASMDEAENFRNALIKALQHVSR
jgi:hypothetical protein